MRNTRVIVTPYGGPEALRVIEEECPEPKDGEVRVRVPTAGVSLLDIMAREGVHPGTRPVPFTAGWDLVGVVDRLGEGRDWLQLVRVVVNAFVEPPSSGLYIASGWLLPGRKRVAPYSIQTLKRLKPAWFRQDLIVLFDLLQRQEPKPLIARRFPLCRGKSRA